ncbi:hypothetical protein [Streptomyces lydicus]
MVLDDAKELSAPEAIQALKSLVDRLPQAFVKCRWNATRELSFMCHL